MPDGKGRNQCRQDDEEQSELPWAARVAARYRTRHTEKVVAPDLAALAPRMVAALGPTIRQPNYEVGPEFIARFKAEEPDSSRFFAPATRAGHAMFDLAGFIAARLARAGVGQVEDLGACTYADPASFYSYRRTTHRAEPDYGRHVNAIALVP